MRVSGGAGDVVQFLHIARTNTECEYRRSCILHKIRCGSWIATVAEAVSYQEHHFVGCLAAFCENRLKKKERIIIIK